MKRRYSLSFRNKLTYSFISITIFAVLITGVLSYYTASQVLESNSLKLTQDSVNTSAQVVDEKLSKLMLIMMTFMISEPFKDLLEAVSTGEQTGYFQHLSNMDTVFSQARVAEPLIHSIFVSTPMGDFYPTSINRNHQVSFKESELYERISVADRNIWVESHEDELFSGKSRVISLILEPITDSTSFSVKDVYVVVNIRESGLRRLIGTDTVDGSLRFLVNQQGELVVNDQRQLIQEIVGSGLLPSLFEQEDFQQQTHHYRDQDYFLNYAPLGLNEWMIVSLQSKDNVLQDLQYVKWTIVYIAIGCLVMALLVSSGLIRYLLKPIKTLLTVMKRVEHNDLTVRYDVKHEDELAQVGIRFNGMLEQIISLIEEVKLAEQNKRTTEIKALSAQMDPHFLYNTLNTIYWKLNMDKTEESQRMLMALSQLFQLGLNKGKEFTTIQKEVMHVEQYLELQRYCYEQLFEYEITVNPSLNDVLVPRIMLQPLVENAILHGFKNMEHGGRIRIVIEEHDGNAIITVEDNGEGMTPALTLELLQQSTKHGYAVGNLVSRLQLYYGEKERWITMWSEEGKGVRVVITIPLEEGINEKYIGV